MQARNVKMKESDLHKQICNYIRYQYPKVLFNTDLSGLKLSIGQAAKVKNLRSCNGFPDIVIYEQKEYWDADNFYANSCALFLEVKKESPYLKAHSKELKKNKHIQMQSEVHYILRDKGYFVEFVWTFDMAKELIDWYLKG